MNDRTFYKINCKHTTHNRSNENEFLVTIQYKTLVIRKIDFILLIEFILTNQFFQLKIMSFNHMQGMYTFYKKFIGL